MKAIHRQHHIRVTRWPHRSRSVWTEPGAVHRGKPPEHQLCFYPLAYSGYFIIIFTNFLFCSLRFQEIALYLQWWKSKGNSPLKRFSFVKTAEERCLGGLTFPKQKWPSRVSKAFITQQAVGHSSSAFVVIVISIYCIFKKSRYICCTIRL